MGSDVGPDLQAQIEGEEALLAGLDHAGRGHHHGLARRLDLGDGVAEPVHLHSGHNEGGQEGFTIKDEGGGGWVQMLGAKNAVDTKHCARPVASRGV